MTNIKIYIFHKGLEIKVFLLMHTSGSSLQSRSEGRHHAGISDLSWFSHSDLEGTPRNVAAVEPNVNRMNSVFPRNESNSMLVCRKQRHMSDSDCV